MCIESESKANSWNAHTAHSYRRFPGIQCVCMERTLMIRIGDDRIRSWRMRHLYHADVTAGDRMDKRLRFNVLVNHNSGSVATLKGPKDVTEYMVSSVKLRQQRSRCRAPLSGRDKSRQFCETQKGIHMAV